uniref:Uncharacterized protein n=1 Tax=Anguilla anguilla TaxID=7936 RepID=A0A0E9SK74_ANGAN
MPCDGNVCKQVYYQRQSSVYSHTANSTAMVLRMCEGYTANNCCSAVTL